MNEKSNNIWKSRPDDKYKFDHLVKILIEKHGWTKIPLFTGKEIGHNN